MVQIIRIFPDFRLKSDNYIFLTEKGKRDPKRAVRSVREQSGLKISAYSFLTF